jgi:uncharacterized protein (TIGR01244 family)
MEQQPIQVRQIAQDLYAAPQLSAASMQGVAAAGFRSVINNRPDFEAGPTQPQHAQIEAAARAAGLEYRFLPVQPGFQTPEEADALNALLDELPRPVLMFCRTGTRSNSLFQQALHRKASGAS